MSHEQGALGPLFLFVKGAEMSCTLCSIAEVVVAAVLLVIVAVCALRWYFHVPYNADEIHWAKTEDGFHLALHRRKPVQQRFVEPVVLCHGLGANRYNLDFPGHSLAQYFAERGYDVWVCELRNCGRSQRPRPWNGLNPRWTFDDLLAKDVPAILAKVREVTGQKEVLWAGHSMGGMLMYAYLGQGGKGVRAAFALASPSTWPGYEWTYGLFKLMHLIKPFPIMRQEPFAPIAAAMHGIYTPKIMLKMANAENLEVAFTRRIIVNVAANHSWNLMAQFGRWIKEKHFRSMDDRIDYLESIRNIRVPFGFAAGSADQLAPPQSVLAAYERCASPDKVYREFGCKTGAKADYGHGDIVFAKSAIEEVFPFVEGFLHSHATPNA